MTAKIVVRAEVYSTVLDDGSRSWHWELRDRAHVIEDGEHDSYDQARRHALDRLARWRRYP